MCYFIEKSNVCRGVLSFLVLLLVMLFFVGGPDYYSPRSFKAFWNLGHILFFAIFPLLVFPSLHRRGLKYSTQVIIILLLTLVIGAGVECVQYGVNRIPDLGDMFRNMLGALIAIFIILPTKQSFGKIGLSAARTGIIILVLVQFQPVAVALYDEYHARENFPILEKY